MGRLLTSVIRVEGELVAATPVHAGGAGETPFSDLPLAVDGFDNVYIPGSSLAGPLRAWWRAADPARADEVWGRVENRSGSKARTGWASIIHIEDAPLAGESERELRQNVGIDRATGTAAGTFKFDRELNPVGARFRLALELQRPAGTYGPEAIDDARWEELRALLRGMIEALADERIRIGAGKTRGLGVVALENAGIVERDLAGGILATLRSAPSSLSVADYFGELEPVTPPRLTAGLHLACRPAAPVMQRHEAEGTMADMMPAVAIDHGRRMPFLAGSGIKGAFRAQSARILRTVLGLEYREDEKLELVEALYGEGARPIEKEAHAPDVSDPRYPQPGRGAVNFDDSRLDRPLKLAEWRKLLSCRPSAEDSERLAEFSDVIAKTEWSSFTPAAHVAIDRWTGGAAEGALFSRLEPDRAELELTGGLDFDRIAPPSRFWVRFDKARQAEKRDKDAERQALARFRHAAVALFLLTLRDFARGRIPLGYGVNRGLGDLDLTEARFTEVAEWHGVPLDAPLTPEAFEGSATMKRFAPLQQAWTDYIEAAHG